MKYIGVKLIEAEPMTCEEFTKAHHPVYYSGEDQNGYAVTYSEGYISWSPKDVFEKAYLRVGDNNTITQENVDSFIHVYQDFKVGEKTTVVKATLANGCEIFESSSCVDPSNFNQDMGINICLGKIKDRVWVLLGFLLQCGVKGIK